MEPPDQRIFTLLPHNTTIDSYVLPAAPIVILGSKNCSRSLEVTYDAIRYDKRF